MDACEMRFTQTLLSDFMDLVNAPNDGVDMGAEDIEDSKKSSSNQPLATVRLTENNVVA